LSPGLLLGHSKNGSANDIGALGITFIELVAGHPPWRSKEYTALPHEIVQRLIAFPPELNQKLFVALQRMLVGAPEERVSADQLLAYL
jgi:serine/threonine protein kinase